MRGSTRLLALSFGLLPACSDELIAVERPAEMAPASGRYGLVVLTARWGEPGVAISGQLMDYQGISRREALHALAAPELAWLAEPVVSPGSCSLLEVDGNAPAHDARVDLLDAGPLTLRAPAPLDERFLVPPRELPPLIAALAGVVYDAADAGLPYLAGGLYQLAAEGAEIGPLTGEVRAPGPVWLEGHTLDEAGLDIRIGGGPDALVLLSRTGGGRPLAVACRPLEGADTLRMPVEALGHLGPGPAELVLFRVRREALIAEGLPGSLLFVTRDTAWLNLPEPALFEERAR